MGILRIQPTMKRKRVCYGQATKERAWKFHEGELQESSPDRRRREKASPRKRIGSQGVSVGVSKAGRIDRYVSLDVQRRRDGKANPELLAGKGDNLESADGRE